MSKKFPLLSVFAAIFALCLMVASPALAHHDADHDGGAGNDTSTTTSEEHGQSAEDHGKPADSSANTKGNDRKEGYEDNSSTPQETNHGAGADNDGDADSDPNTAHEDDHTTADEGDNAHPSGKDRSVENGGSGNQGRSESNPDDSKGPMRYEGTQGDDKPAGPGGTDLADQDGNNGCGNDDDFDDDNNGWCGKPVRTTTPPTPPQVDDNKPCDANPNMPGVQKCETPPTVVLPDRIENPTPPCDRDNNMANGIQPCNEVQAEEETKPCDADNNMANGIQPCHVVLPDLETRPSTPVDNVLGVRLSRAPAVGAAVAPAVTEAAPAVEGAVLPFTGGDMAMFLVAALGLIVLGGTALKVRRNES
ncbi:MAG TPA: hypothetical protein VJ927_03895 [Actinomycetota bacterium]|nr:hypothetical protein [Actinomycetota bacterium]